MRPDTAALTVLSCFLAFRFIRAHPAHGFGPDGAWSTWADQGRYFRAALAWVHGDLAGELHYYPAGYALLGAPFVPVAPADPFAPANLLCWIGALWTAAELAAVCMPWRRARVIGGCVFAACTALPSAATRIWIVPWSSTPVCLLSLLALLAAARAAAGSERALTFAAAAAGGIVLFRPMDVLAPMPAIAAALAMTLAHARTDNPRRLCARVLAAAAAGPALFAATHLATHGWHLGAYLERSRQYGFEPGLLPLRWTTLILSPRPLYPEGRGLAQVYWWMLPGFAGMLACCAADRGRRVIHCLLASAAVGATLIYLCYRDLLAYGLFRYDNQHYFKWVVPLTAVYALRLFDLLRGRRTALVPAGALAAVAALCCWRPVATKVTRAEDTVHLSADGRGLVLGRGFGVAHAVFVRAEGDWLSIYGGDHQTSDGSARGLVKLFPIAGGFMLTPLRTLPRSTPTTVIFAPGVSADTRAPVLVGRQQIVFGLPCFIAPHRAACTFRSVLF